MARGVVAGPLTIGAALGIATSELGEVSETGRLDAELLLGAVLELSRAQLVIENRRVLRDREWMAFEAVIGRRAAQEPVAYILGRRAFRRLELEVDRRVLIPRPETELLVEVGLACAPGATVLDVGTGSGAVALALADERPDLAVRGVDVSPDAVAVARANAARLRLDVSFMVADLLDGCEPVDCVLANLPYVAAGEALPADVADWEPAGALFAGPDGLGVIRELVGTLHGLAWPSRLGLEIGCDQGEAVAALVAAAGFASVQVRRDLAGLDRVVVGER